MKLNRNISLLFLGITIIIALDSCQTKPKLNQLHRKIIQEWYQKSIYLPWKDLYEKNIINEMEFSSISQKDIKILTLIDTSCPVCIQEAKKWKTFRSHVDTSYVGFIFILYSSDQFMGLDENALKKNINFPYIKDIDGSIFKLNNFPLDKKHQTFLLNSKNQVLLIGNPNQNVKIHKLYQEFINNYFEKNILGVSKNTKNDS